MKSVYSVLTLLLLAGVSPPAWGQEQQPAEKDSPETTAGVAVAQASDPKSPTQQEPGPGSQQGTGTAQAPATGQPATADPKSPTQQEPGPGSQPLSPAAAKPPPGPTSIKYGGVSLTPYGTIVASAHWNTAGFGSAPCSATCETTEATGAATSGDFPNFANGMPGSFVMSSRLSRFGVNLDLPAGDLGATIKGQVEIDFAGGFTGGDNGLQWYVPVPRLRLANGTLKMQLSDAASVSILAGLAPGVIAPLFGFRPSFHTPIFYWAGNLWRRSPQFRIFGDIGGDFSLTWAAAMLSPVTNLADTATTQLIRADFSPGTRAKMPDFEARVGVLYKQEKKTVADVGVSTHVGQEYYMLSGADKEIDSFALALDANLSFGFIGVRGEAFTGRNMDSAQGNFGSGVRFIRAATSGPPDDVVPIDTRGIWGQLLITPIPQLQLVGGYGFEDPDDTDLGDPVPATAKTRNSHIYGAVMVNPVKAWFAAFEFIQTDTDYGDVLPNGMGPDLMSRQFTLSTGFSF